MANIENIKERIAKLLAMAKDASSPNEAAIAAGRARKLMDQHQLEDFDIQKKVVDDFAKKQATKAAETVPTFMSTMAVAVAKYNDCYVRYEYEAMEKATGNRAWGKVITFHGFREDVDLAIDMFNRLEDAVRRLSKDYFRVKQIKYSHKICRQFELGAVSEIINRLKLMTVDRQMISSANAGKSLIVVKDALIVQHFGTTQYREGRANNIKDAAGLDAFINGKIKGKTVEITPQVDK